jgi:hypothetical protein
VEKACLINSTNSFRLAEATIARLCKKIHQSINIINLC